MNDALPAREPGELLAYVAKQLSEIVSLKNGAELRKPGFKFCLDDCEVLSTPQQVSINTLVRVCKAPVSWVVSYVGSQFEDSKTYIDRQTLSDADRRVESLDSRSKETFRELCQAVVSLRLLFDVSESMRTKRRVTDIKSFFALRQRLGLRSVNEMFDIMTRRSVRPIAKSLRQSAERVHGHLSPNFTRTEPNSSVLPFYQTYTLLHWLPQSGSFKSEFGRIDEEQILERSSLLKSASDEAWLRRKQRAALLHFSSAIGFRILPLAGENIVVSLADGSIRDFLEILGFIYEAYVRQNKLDMTSRTSLDKFVASGSQIAGDTQTTGIYNASNAYFAGVGARAEKDFDVVLRLIDGLGHYTSLLQSRQGDPTVFGRAERGIFNIKFEALGVNKLTEGSDRERVVWNTLRNAELSGYLRTVDVASREILNSEGPNGGALIIRLHRRFAPYFRFSFRGPYEASIVHAADLWLLCDRANPIDPSAWAEQISGTTSTEQQFDLPLAWDTDND